MDKGVQPVGVYLTEGLVGVLSGAEPPIVTPTEGVGDPDLGILESWDLTLRGFPP